MRKDKSDNKEGDFIKTVEGITDYLNDKHPDIQDIISEHFSPAG